MTDIVPPSSKKLDNGNDGGPWYEGTHRERIAVRLSSLDTNGAYAVVESIAAPGCATPMHRHRDEEEHVVIVAGSYRIAIGEEIFEASVGASITLPKGPRHSWRNISSEPGRMVIILTPGPWRLGHFPLPVDQAGPSAITCCAVPRSARPTR
jgi:quercetin dioxygenase-like cupin family protein